MMFQIREQKGGGRREREREPQQQDRHSDCATRQNYRPTTCYLYGVKKEKESFRHFFISLRSLSPSLSLSLPPLSLSFFLSFALFVIPLLLFIFPHKNVTVPIVDNVISSVCSHFTLKKKKKNQNIYLNLKEKDYKDKIPTNRGLLILLFLFLLLFLPFVYAHCDIFIYHFETPLDPKKGNNI